MPDDQLSARAGRGAGGPAGPGITLRATADGVLAVLAGVPLGQAAARIGMEPADLADAVETYQAAGLAALHAQVVARDGWHQVRVEFADWDAAEQTAATGIGPHLEQAQDAGLVAQWWFIRKAPCWRLRLRSASHAASGEMKESVGSFLDGLAEAGLITGWRESIYEPETCAFGGPLGMRVAHDLFHDDSRAVLRYLRLPVLAAPAEPALSRRELSVLLCSALFRGAEQDWYEQGDVWHQVTDLRPLLPGVPVGRLSDMTVGLRRLMTVAIDPAGPLFGPRGPLASATSWAVAFDQAGQSLAVAAGDGTLERGLRDISRAPRDLPLEPPWPGHPDAGHPRASGTPDRHGPAARAAQCPGWWAVTWPEPADPGVAQRMRAAHELARATLCVQPDQDAGEAWGWHGRTLGAPVTTPDGPAWLRIACAPARQPATIFWYGSVEAEKSMPSSVPRPRLRTWHDWTDQRWKYRAELYERVADRPAAAWPILMTAPDLPPQWWTAARAALDAIAAVPTRRVAVRQSFLDQAMPRLLGTPISTTAPSPWTTAHGDFHFANLCAPNLRVLDFEGWGLAPAGYDAATLHTYSLLVPQAAARVRSELAHILDTPAGRFAELVVITEHLHAFSSGNPASAERLRQRAATLLSRPRC